MQVIGYTRVSTVRQAEDGVSLDTQAAKINAWADLNEYEVLDIHTDAGITGRRVDIREGLQNAVEAACKHKAALVVYSLSRLARNTRETLEISERLRKSGANLVSLSESIDTTSAAGKMIFGVLAVLAQFESDQTSERVTEAMAYAKSQGRRVGKIPYGYRLGEDESTLVEDEKEQAVIRQIQELHRSGLSLRAIAQELEERGIRTKSGLRNWSPKVLSTILKQAA